MNDDSQLSISALRSKRGSETGGRTEASARPAPAAPMTVAAKAKTGGASVAVPFDPKRVAAALRRRWLWLVGAGAALAFAGGWLGIHTAKYVVEVKLIRREAPGVFGAGLEGQSLKPREMSAQTLISLMRSPELLRRVSAMAQPPVTLKSLLKNLTVAAERDTDLLVLQLAGKNPSPTVDLANLYAGEVVRFTQEMQARELSEINKSLKQKLAGTEKELADVNKELSAFSRAAEVVDVEKETQACLQRRADVDLKVETARMELETLDLKINVLRQELAGQNPKLVAAKEELENALVRMTDEHPRVKELRARVAALENELAAAGTNAASAAGAYNNPLAVSLYMQVVELQTRKVAQTRELDQLTALQKQLQDRLGSLAEKGVKYAVIKAPQASLEASRKLLAGRQREAELSAANAAGYYRLVAPASLADVRRYGGWGRAMLFAVAGAMLGMLGVALVVFCREFTGARATTAVDVQREPPHFLKERLLKWVVRTSLIAALAAARLPAAEGDEQAQPAAAANTHFSVATRAQRAAWQERLTLGPGDVMNFSLYGQPEFTRSEVFVGPDGRVSYLQAQDIMASGLTIDELRAKFDEALAKYYRTPRTIITPAITNAFRSKKYFVLGNVVQKGVFMLDRPITIIEAIARARGFEAAAVQRTTLELADLPRSFLVRQGKRVTVDFEKLFLQGDLTQNIPLEPDDYLYFPPVDLKEVYVVGEVRTPGVQMYVTNLTAIGAIAGRGGFTDRAWRKRILIVRGSLDRPQTFELDAAGVLTAKAADFKLEPRDIIYVSARPWIMVEEILERATTTFLNTMVVTWTGQNIGPFIKNPIIE